MGHVVHIGEIKLTNSWSRVILETLLVAQLVKKFPIFYGMWKFIHVFTRAALLSLFWARLIQSMLSHLIPLWSTSVSSHLCLHHPSGLFPTDSHTKIFYAFLMFPIHATYPTHLILFGWITLIWWAVQSWRSSLCNFLQLPVTSSLLGPKMNM